MRAKLHNCIYLFYAKASENVSQRIPMNTQAQKPAKQQQQEQQPTEQVICHPDRVSYHQIECLH